MPTPGSGGSEFDHIPEISQLHSVQKGMSSDNGVLLDSGANEILRQQETRPARSQPLPLTLANGSSIDAFRTKEGVVVAVGVENGEVVVVGV